MSAGRYSRFTLLAVVIKSFQSLCKIVCLLVVSMVATYQVSIVLLKQLDLEAKQCIVVVNSCISLQAGFLRQAIMSLVNFLCTLYTISYFVYSMPYLWMFNRIQCMFKRIQCMFERIPCMFDRIPCMFDRIPCMFDRIPCMFDRIPCMFDRIPCMFDRIPCMFDRIPCMFDRIPCMFDRIPCMFDRIPCMFDRIPCMFDRIPCMFDRIPCMFDRIPCMFDRIPCMFDRIPCMFDRILCMFWRLWLYLPDLTRLAILASFQKDFEVVKSHVIEAHNSAVSFVTMSSPRIWFSLVWSPFAVLPPIWLTLSLPPWCLIHVVFHDSMPFSSIAYFKYYYVKLVNLVQLKLDLNLIVFTFNIAI